MNMERNNCQIVYMAAILLIFPVFTLPGQAQPIKSGIKNTTLRTSTQSTSLQTGTQSTSLHAGTQNTNLQTGTQSTDLHTGTQSTNLQTGTQSTLIQGATQGNLIQGQVEQETGPVNILFVIDASYSMKEGLGSSEHKMEAAKRVLQEAIEEIPPEVNLGLRVFGQGFTGDPYFDCQQSALLVPLGQGNRRSIIERIRQIHPFGLTPLTFALSQAEHDLKGLSGPKTLILITDGAETCGGNPCEYILRLHEIGIKMKVDIVGLGLRRDREARAQLNCIASASGGKYYDASTAAELIDSISHSITTAISGHVITKASTHELNAEPKTINPVPPK